MKTDQETMEKNKINTIVNKVKALEKRINNQIKDFEKKNPYVCISVNVEETPDHPIVLISFIDMDKI
jgi:hypothetical protein